MVGPVEVDPIALVVSFAVALVIPTTAVYLLIAYRTEQRLDDVTVLGEAQLKALSDDLDRHAGDERRDRESLSRRVERMEADHVRIDRPRCGPQVRPPPREDRLRPGR